MVSPTPVSVTVRMYQVGFGDCFLVSFAYEKALEDGRTARHMLVDFGSTHGPKTSRGGPSVVETAAERIREHTDGKLDVVVVTHRHRDHISGFGDAEAAAVISELEPALVVRPWTEHPDLPRDATAPIEVESGDPRMRFAVNLAAGHRLADRIEALSRGARSDTIRGQLAHLALDQVPNADAIAFLDQLADSTGGGEYLSAGMSTRIEEAIPGIGVRVLGPPTIEQHAEITKSRSEDPDEFWIAQLSALETLSPEDLTDTPTALADLKPGPEAWVVERLARQQLASLQRIVRTVDDALNNTSLILLIDAGDKRLLLPGDAQIENWSWALEAAPEAEQYRSLLAKAHLYKVGHHGSRNATPKSLFRLWEEGEGAEQPMTALLSTMPGVHGRSAATAVPRGPLVEALARRMDLIRTDGLELGAGFVTVTAPCAGKEPFKRR